MRIAKYIGIHDLKFSLSDNSFTILSDKKTNKQKLYVEFLSYLVPP